MKKILFILTLLITINIYSQGDFRVNSLRYIPQASAPSNPKEGTRYLNSTDNRFYQYVGGQWVQESNLVPIQSTPPSTPQTGDRYVDTDNYALYIYNGSAWVSLSGNIGKKVFTEVGTNTTITDSDFELTGDNENAQPWIVPTDTINITINDITAENTLFIKPLINSQATVTAGGSQLFWIANEDRYMNAFIVNNMNSVGISKRSASLLAVEGNVNAYFVDNTPPGTVGSLAASNIQSTSATLTWTHATDDEGVSYYQVSTDNITYSPIGYVLTYDLQGLTASTSTTAYIQAVDINGNVGSQTNVNFTTAGGFSLLTAGNSNPNIISTGSGSFVADDTGIYDSTTGDHYDPVQISSQTAVAESVNSSTYVNELIGTGSVYSRGRLRFGATAGQVYEYDFFYKMVGGGTHGALRINGNFVANNLSATDWTLISGEYTEDDTFLGVDVYASNSNSAANGEGIRWKMIVKLKD